MMAKDIKMVFDIKNLGPHTALQFDDQAGSINVGIYANNGAGKTFISRAFRLILSKNNPSTANKLLTKKQTTGKFVFKINNTADTVKQSRNLEITLNKNSEPIVINDTGYLFHVFNSDYVDENLELMNYTPNGDIQGYILGKTNIDVTKEKEKLNNIIVEKEAIEKLIKEAIKKAIDDLDILMISKTTNEYKSINFENVISGVTVLEDDNFLSLKGMQRQLNLMPDDIDDIPSDLYYNIDSSAQNDLERLLCTAYTKSAIHQDVIKKFKSKKDFIEQGIKLYHLDNKQCPFCEQKLDEKALAIIDLYNKYIEDLESKIIKEFDIMINRLKKLKSDIEDYYKKFNEINTKYNDMKKYLPSFKTEELKILNNNETVLVKIDELINMFNIKKNDITIINFEPKEQISVIIAFLKNLKEDLSVQIKKISLLNKSKNSIGEEKLKLKKRLCNARYLNLVNEQSPNIKQCTKLALEIEKLVEDIKIKESTSKINKKEKVIQSIKYFLNFFFDNKYEFDENKFCIKFMDEILSDNAKDVLSEGEKGIVAFCYYLATTHTIIKNEDDYKRLFFVIDDPISSMDFNFVYAVTQIIRRINQHFNEGSFDRFIILTHNLEFMNVLMRNHVVNQKYILEKNKISIWKQQLMLPYENHLSDIIRIAKGELEPSHTTANSIRHILETICKFEYRDKSIENFISEKAKLKDNAYIYSLMQDLSHGAVRSQPPLTREIIVNACTILKEYILAEYSGQLEGLI